MNGKFQFLLEAQEEERTKPLRLAGWGFVIRNRLFRTEKTENTLSEGCEIYYAKYDYQ